MTRTLFAFLFCLCCALFAQTHTDDEYETCYAFMNRINLKTTFEKAKKKAIEAQLSRNPMMANFKPEIVAFANKYFKFESLKQEIADLFLEHFTAPELKKQPVWKRTMQRWPNSTTPTWGRNSRRSNRLSSSRASNSPVRS